ncbi:MAG: hypothetical protein PHD15_02225 [Clostridia bacterium]|nr:hypothetical protein [Clostridia bacterium]MDD4386563.1 hypothetical protein [Clostridia bacterium]
MTHMMFFTILLVVFISLILISIVNTLIFIALKLLTKEHYKEHYLIIPSFISLVLWSMTYIVAMKLISSTTGMSVFDSIYELLFNISSFTKIIPSLIFPFVILLIITLFLQSLVLLTVNIEYAIAFNKLKYFLKNKFKYSKKAIKRDEYSDSICPETKTNIIQVEKKYQLDFINSFVCSLFIFSLLFFLFIIFFWIGTLIGNEII